MMGNILRCAKTHKLREPRWKMGKIFLPHASCFHEGIHRTTHLAFSPTPLIPKVVRKY